MKTISAKTYAASPAEIWQVISQPGNMPAWNEKCVRCESHGPSGRGEGFRADFQMRRKPTSVDGEVIEFEPRRKITFRYWYDHRGRRSIVDESFAIHPASRGSGTRLEHTVRMDSALFPWWIRPVVWLITRFGRKVGRDQLDAIGELLGEVDRG